MSNPAIKRELEVIDMMLSIHARLSQVLHRRAVGLNVIVLAGSIVLNALLFVTDTYLEVWIKSVSVVILFLSMLPFVVHWERESGEHANACKQLASLKDRARHLGSSQADVDQFQQSYSDVMGSLIRIPEDVFLRLKAHHHRKVAISRLISKYPGVPVWILQWRLFRRNAEAVKRVAESSDTE